MHKRKLVTNRAFTGLVGMPPEPEDQNAHINTKHSAPDAGPPRLVKARVLIPAEVVYCLTHAKRHPCPTCIQDELRAREYRERRRLLQRFNASAVQHDVAKPAVALTPSDVAERAAVAQSYNVDKYRKEINLALKHARLLLKGFATGWRDLNDLKQIVDIEIWKAILHYKDRMTPELAYTIAKNQAGKILQQQREEQSVAVTNPDGPEMDEFGQPKRINRFESFDVNGTEQDGEPSETSPIEERIVMADLPPEVNPPLDKLTRSLRLLRRLVEGWFGVKRIVGEVLLRTPDATVRDFPGVPKSTAARVRKAVLAEFRALQGGEEGGVGQNHQVGTY